MSMQNLGLIGMMTIDWPESLKGRLDGVPPSTPGFVGVFPTGEEGVPVVLHEGTLFVGFTVQVGSKSQGNLGQPSPASPPSSGGC